MKKISWFLELTTRSIAVGGLSILLFQAFLIVIDGVLRFTISVSMDIVRDVGPLATAVAVACCLPVVLMEGGNIIMRPFAGLRSPAAVRGIDAFASLFSSVVMAVLGVQFFKYAHEQLKANEITFMLGIPKYPFYYAIASIIILGAAAQLFRFVELAIIREGRK
ncbi:TRAP transporter small permease subunit [Paraburkholderia aspalathi]|nr:TRAP transporter small permease subunit [Paraburkholderia aspalathi]